MKLAKKWLVLPLLLASLALNAQNVDDILAKYFENTGGLQNWKKLKSLKMTGKTPTPQGELPLIMYQKAPNKVKMVIQVQGQEIVAQAYDGKDGWSLNPFAGATTATKMNEEQTKELSNEEFEDEFIDYKQKGHVATLDGTEEIDGVKCFKITLIKNKNNDKDDITEIHYFDAEFYVPILQKSYVRIGPAKGTEIETYFSDYQEVGGLVIPYFIEQKVKGQSAFKVVLENIEINPQLEDSIFAFPAGN